MQTNKICLWSIENFQLILLGFDRYNHLQTTSFPVSLIFPIIIASYKNAFIRGTLVLLLIFFILSGLWKQQMVFLFWRWLLQFIFSQKLFHCKLIWSWTMINYSDTSVHQHFCSQTIWSTNRTDEQIFISVSELYILWQHNRGHYFQNRGATYIHLFCICGHFVILIYFM